ncbi:MAG TPA: hypothetical protein VIM36_10945 [Gemmatimonadaceae bacterium]
MYKYLTGSRRRGLALAVVAALISFGVAACNDTTATDATHDRTPPTVTLTPLTGLADTVISFTTGAKDNLGLKSIHVQAVGAVGAIFDTVFTSAVTDISLPFTLFASRSVPPGTPVIITATAIDGAGNSSGVDTLRMATGNLPPPDVKVLSPFSGSSAVIGKSIVVTIMGKTAVKIRSLGLSTTGPVVRSDSAIFSSPLRDSLTMQDTIAIPLTATPGTLTITPFLRDSLGQRAIGTSITITVQTAASVNSVPVVNAYCVGNSVYDNACGHVNRIEVGDTVHVEADDPSGIAQLGYEVRSTVGGPIDDSSTYVSSGQLTFEPHTFSLNLPYTTFPTIAYIQTFAQNANGVRAYSKLASGVTRVDTVTVVAGVTRPLPAGGVVADAMYHAGKDRLYITNITQNRVEVFDLATLSFQPGVIVGSRPWGIAGWPADNTGALLDTLLVANSGGTSISYVALDAAGNGVERRRYQLPNIIAYTITTSTSATSGLPITVRTKYDFSDRPQYLAATCRPAGGVCGDVILAYSTTPTQGQSVPFQSNNGTLRWEDLTIGGTAAGPTDPRTSHFFFEQAIGQSSARSDTLEIIRYDANGIDQTVLVPYAQHTVVDINRLGFRDTTFVRGSGDFNRAIFGEGGPTNGSRAMTYNVTRGFADPFNPYIDSGVSPASDVSDFIANAFSKVQGVAINFDGSLVAVRGDSTYLLNGALRLQGVLPTTAANAGIDFHPQNNATNFPLSTRLIFTASSQPLIDVYDTNCYQKIAQVQIRDPIIGPVKAALRPTGQLVLVGATARGVVIATLPNTFTTTCP